MAKANEFHAQGDVARANKHWQFAVNDVARQALQLHLPYDGPKGNVQIWTEGIIDMQRIAQERCTQPCASVYSFCPSSSSRTLCVPFMAKTFYSGEYIINKHSSSRMLPALLICVTACAHVC